MINKSEIAVQKYLSGFNCAQSVLFACADDINIDKDNALKLACGFGGGMGRKQKMCGAVTAGVIAIGAKYGRGENDDHTTVDITYSKTRELLEKFQAEYGTLSCLVLLSGCKLSTPEGREYYQENNLKNKVCKKCVEHVMNILEEVL